MGCGPGRDAGQRRAPWLTRLTIKEEKLGRGVTERHEVELTRGSHVPRNGSLAVRGWSERTELETRSHNWITDWRVREKGQAGGPGKGILTLG